MKETKIVILFCLFNHLLFQKLMMWSFISKMEAPPHRSCYGTDFHVPANHTLVAAVLGWIYSLTTSVRMASV